MRDEARDVSDESDKLASRSKMSALAGLVSSVVVGVVFIVFVVVAFLATLVLDLVVGVVVVRDRHAINWLSSSKKKVETTNGGNTLDRWGNVLVCGRETMIYHNTSLLPYIL